MSRYAYMSIGHMGQIINVHMFTGDSYLFEKENEFHKSSCAQLYLQCGPQTDRSNTLVNLISQILTEPCYDCLRTKVVINFKHTVHL